jgi:hypothetical protein
VLKPFYQVIDPLTEMIKREIFSTDVGDVLEVLFRDLRECSLEIGEVFFGKVNDPATCVSEFVASPYTRSRYWLRENFSHRNTPLPRMPLPQLIVWRLVRGQASSFRGI